MLSAKSYVNKVDDRLKSLNNRAHLAESARNELQMGLETREKEVKKLREENESLKMQLEDIKAKEDEIGRLKETVKNMGDDLKYQEAVVTVRVKASMANKFLLGKFEGKKKDLETMVNDYLRLGVIKDLESEEKEEAGDADKSTADSSQAGVHSSVVPSAAGETTPIA